MTERVMWEEARDLIEAQAGPITSARQVSDGRNSAIAVVINGDTFVKGSRKAQNLERRINPYVSHLSAPLRWTVDEEKWSLLGFTYIDGREADFRPGSPDLPLMVETISAIGEITCPDLPMARAEKRWKDYTDRPEKLAGDTLLHTDLNPGNILVSDGKAYVIDWAWSTRGAAWTEPASWAVLLIGAGHTPRDAEEWAARIPAWKQAAPEDITSWANSQARLWHKAVHPHSPKWIVQARHAALAWLSFRAAS
jgi:hypothetical protein